ncbi:hypothetical protein SY89_00999 [Halolamina pelagica]|uniref:Uncharacterized protein n=1 Tax=Halolamina pelagica TaxID=699431 RepID=A0A0P7GNQ2_9EURY|nr:hypothetical protein SY89_00999 [Halolamina pelagica]
MAGESAATGKSVALLAVVDRRLGPVGVDAHAGGADGVFERVLVELLGRRFGLGGVEGERLGVVPLVGGDQRRLVDFTNDERVPTDGTDERGVGTDDGGDPGVS